MKWLKYKINSPVNTGTVESPKIENRLHEKLLSYSEANEEIAKKEAYAGNCIIEDDGKPDPSEAPTQLDIIEAQVTYTALMTDTLLEEA